MRFNSPPNWPTPPPGWTPPPDWQPDPAWGPPPPNWPLWVPDAPKNRTPLIVGGIVAVLAVAAIIVTVLYFTVWSKEEKSDEDQIRSIVAGLQDAWNANDQDEFEGYLCEKDQDRWDEDDFGAENDSDGPLVLAVESVEVDDEKATAKLTSRNENDDEDDAETEDLVFVREDGDWKACFSESRDSER